MTDYEQKQVIKNICEEQKNRWSTMRTENPDMFKGITWYYFENGLVCNNECVNIELNKSEIEMIEEKFGKFSHIEKW